MKIVRERKEKRMRPSNWNERVASLYASFDGKRLRYCCDISPGFSDGQRCIRVSVSSDKCQDILRFAEEYDLEVIDCPNDKES